MFSEHLKDTKLYLREVIISCILCKRRSGKSFEVQGSFQCYTIMACKLVHFALLIGKLRPSEVDSSTGKECQSWNKVDLSPSLDFRYHHYSTAKVPCSHL